MQSLYLYDSEHSDQRYCVLSYTQHAARTLNLTKQVFKTAFCAHIEVLALSFLFSAMYWCTSVRDSGVNAVGSFQNLKTKHQFEKEFEVGLIKYVHTELYNLLFIFLASCRWLYGLLSINPSLAISFTTIRLTERWKEKILSVTQEGILARELYSSFSLAELLHFTCNFHVQYYKDDAMNR